MRKHLTYVLACFASVLLAGCVTESEPERSPIRLGMSRDDVRFYLGEPLRREPTTSRGEDWYYRVVSGSNFQMDGAVEHDPYEGSDAVAVSVSPSAKVKGECPIHFSADGQVIEPLPEGKIQGR